MSGLVVIELSRRTILLDFSLMISVSDPTLLRLPVSFAPGLPAGSLPPAFAFGYSMPARAIANRHASTAEDIRSSSDPPPIHELTKSLAASRRAGEAA